MRRTTAIKIFALLVVAATASCAVVAYFLFTAGCKDYGALPWPGRPGLFEISAQILIAFSLIYATSIAAILYVVKRENIVYVARLLDRLNCKKDGEFAAVPPAYADAVAESDGDGYLTNAFGHKWLEFRLPFACDIHFGMEQRGARPGVKQVLAAFSEPKQKMASSEKIRETYRKYDLIVTYDKSLLSLPNVQILSFGGCWCAEPPDEKELSVSTVLSTGSRKNALEGYNLRKRLAVLLPQSPIPAKLFLSSRRLNLTLRQIDELAAIADRQGVEVSFLPKQDKAVPFRSMFHIAIENSRHDGYFTEKLIDCFSTFTVPIYYGAPDIGDFFDVRGMMIVETLDDIMTAMSRLTPESYWGRLAFIKINHEKAQKYLRPDQALRSLLLKEL